jgi:signal peptidase I
MNFALILLLLCLATGALWFADRFVWRKGRPAGSNRPAWLEYTAGFFPVLFLVFFVRSFLFEPFNIPSGSMIPTLRIGDLILVQKYSYGIRLPVAHTLVIPTGQPARGDVAVFRYPKDESVDYIKRIVGLPGDEIVFEGKQLVPNGQPIPRVDKGVFVDPGSVRASRRYTEQIGTRQYDTLNDLGAPEFFFLESFPNREACERTPGGMRCKVPEGHYFAMGDNRDNSADSRIWGFVPARNLVGKAVVIWFNASEVFSGDFSRLGGIE